MEKSAEYWKNIEENVNLAENAKRRANKASVRLKQETALNLNERQGMDREYVIDSSKRSRVAKKAYDNEEINLQEAEEILGSLDSSERSLVSLRKQELVKALKRDRDIEKKRKTVKKEQIAIWSEIHEVPDGSEQEALNELQDEMDKLSEEEKNLLESSPEAFIGLHLQELRQYKAELEEYKFVETPYVRDKADEIEVHLRASKPEPVFIHGHLGSGKTELAEYISKRRLGKEPEVISGSKFMSMSEIYGHQVLSADKNSPEELKKVSQDIEQKYIEWLGLNPLADDTEKTLAHDRILQVELTNYQGKVLTEFMPGPIYRAMIEGKPFIIDEVNAIPHEILISLNRILTKKPGDKIKLQQDSGREIIIQEGFCVMMTGNINDIEEKYTGREEMDVAWLSRSTRINYDYLPQTKEGALENSEGKDKDELFHLLLAMVMDRQGNIEAPDKTINKLWNLAKAAKEFQDNFSGKEITQAHYQEVSGGRPVEYRIKKEVLSLRALAKILNAWKRENFLYELDYYIYKEFASQSTVSADRSYIYKELTTIYGFFKSENWPDKPKYDMPDVEGSFAVMAPKNRAGKPEHIDPRQTVIIAFGQPPERRDFPEDQIEESEVETKMQTEQLEKLQQFQDFKEKINTDLKLMRKEMAKKINTRL